MLELDEIQHFLLARPRALAARYGFLTFRQPAGGRAWLSGIIDKVGTGRVVGAGGSTDSRWVTVAFTWNGLRALGVPEASLAAFPEAALAASCTPSVCSGRYMRMRTGIASRGNGCMVNRR